MICPAVNFLQGVGKICRGDKGWLSLTLVAEATAQVAAIGNLDKDFFEFSQSRSISKNVRLAGERSDTVPNGFRTLLEGWGQVFNLVDRGRVFNIYFIGRTLWRRLICLTKS
jgi:hypothetical protein